MFGLDETPYDLRWRMFGIHVRVHPLFWVMSAVLCWDYLQAVGTGQFFLCIACIFVSILIHELGHVVIGNAFGSYGHIVLWGFGGLAIGSGDVDRRWKRIAVSFAGPAAQFLFYGVLWLLQRYAFTPEWFMRLEPRWMLTLILTLNFLLWVNLYWPILNLLPIWPLDGGQITRQLFGYFTPREAVRLSLHLSIGVSGLLALHALLTMNREPFISFLPTGRSSALFFAVFAGLGIQTLWIENQQRQAFDPWDHERW